MQERDLQDQLRMMLESGSLDDPDADEPRSSACLAMSRLATLAAGDAVANAAEHQHLATCGICRGRLQAFGREPLLPAAVPASRTRRSGSLVLRLATVAAAAACVAYVIYPSTLPTTAPPAQPAPARATSFPPISPNDLWVGRVAGDESAGGHTCVAVRCDEASGGCVVMAVYRACDESCACVDWEVVEWEQGGQLADLDPRELVDLAIDFAGRPASGHVLVMATTPRHAQLPQTQRETTRLLRCLNNMTPTGCVEEGALTYAGLLDDCLPSGVTLVEETFWAE